jgi:hypothetical protein
MSNLSRAKVSTLLFLALGLFLALFCRAEGNSSVIINEIAWMGTKTSYNDEWLELYNNTNSEINLVGWQLISQDKAPAIILTGKIPAKGFYLLERSNDDTIPEILADQIYSGAMGNNGEKLILFDNFKNIIDSVDCSAGWFNGDNATKQTMEKKGATLLGNNAANWQNSQNPGGTAKTANSPGLIESKSQLKPKNAVPTSTGDQNNSTSVVKKQTASIKNNLPADNSAFLVLASAVSFALISGAAILVLKKKSGDGLEK